MTVYSKELSRSDDWIGLLSHHARQKNMFTTKFPPENTSLFQIRKEQRITAPRQDSKSWKNSDIFHQKYILHLKFTEAKSSRCFGYETGAKSLPPLVRDLNQMQPTQSKWQNYSWMRF